METIEASSYLRRFSRHILLLLFFGSITCILSYVSILNKNEILIIFEDVIHIAIAVLQAECAVLALAVIFPFCTRTLNVHAIFCGVTSVIWMVVRIKYLHIQRYSLDSIIITACFVFLPLCVSVSTVSCRFLFGIVLYFCFGFYIFPFSPRGNPCPLLESHKKPLSPRPRHRRGQAPAPP